MIDHNSRHVGPRFGRGNWSGPRFFRGYRRPAFSYARPGSHRLSGRWQQPTAEQQALRSTAAEVARLFVIAARAAHGNAEQQGNCVRSSSAPAKSFPSSSTEAASILSRRTLRTRPK